MIDDDTTVPPVSVQLVGADQALSAGKEVVLSCLVRGSRPPPLVTWMLDDRTLSEMIALPVKDKLNIENHYEIIIMINSI